MVTVTGPDWLLFDHSFEGCPTVAVAAANKIRLSGRLSGKQRS